MASTNRDEISRLELLHAAHPDGLVFPHLADAYRRAGRYAQAESVLNAGLRRHADYSSAHVVLGRLRLDQGKRREAENAFERVLQLDPENHVALDVLARLAAEEGRTDEALVYLRRLAALKPSEEVADRITTLERRLRESERARAAPSRSAGTEQERPASPKRQPGGEAVRENGGDGTEPESAREPSSELPEPGEVVTETMAELYARQGLHERAEAVYRQLAARDPGNARLQRKLEEAANRRGGGTRAAESASAPEREPESAPGPEQGPEPESAPGPERGPEPESGPGRPRREPWGAERTEVEEPHTAEAEATPGVRSYLQGVLSWRPETEPEAAAADATTVTDERGEVEADEMDFEPWAEAAVSEPGKSSIAPVTDPIRSEPPITDHAGSAPAGSEAGAAEASPGEGAAPARPRPEALGTGAELSRPGAEPSRPGAEPPGAEAEPPGAREGSADAASVGRDPTGLPQRVRPGPTAAELGLVADELEGADARSRALIALTDMLVGLLEYRDPFFRGSSSLTRLIAMNVANELELDASERVNLALAAVLRDLGRLAMGGRLVESREMWRESIAREKIERHVDLALHLMEGVELPRSVLLAVRHHHERWDGAGYPDGLAGEEIPYLARVLAVVDSFAAMVSPRPYRLPRKVPDATRELTDASGTQYDPEVVDALLRVLDRRDQPHLGFVQRHHILLVNPDQPGAVVTAAKLCTAGYLAEVVVDGDAARERLRRVPVAAIVVSAETGAEEALDLIRDLRLDPLFASLPVVVVDAESVALRVRLLEGGADVCFPPGVSYGELHGTLGALVRRTLRSREKRPESGDDEAPWLALQGDLQDFPLAWLLQVMKYDSRTAGIGIRTATEQGAIYIENGDAVHAQIRGGDRGEPALKDMLQWRDGRFTVQPNAQSKEQSIQSSIMHLLLTQAVEEDHAAAGVFGTVTDHG